MTIVAFIYFIEKKASSLLNNKIRKSSSFQGELDRPTGKRSLNKKTVTGFCKKVETPEILLTFIS